MAHVVLQVELIQLHFKKPVFWPAFFIRSRLSDWMLAMQTASCPLGTPPLSVGVTLVVSVWE
jgi:hypothetical protein